jgi:K+-transporting ATPase ATPase C chain
MMKSMAADAAPRAQLKAAVLAILVFTGLTGVIYPLAMTALAQVLFPYRAHGSMIVRDGRLVGSELIGQPFSSPGYFWGRLSATAPAYNGAVSSGSNLGPTNPALIDAVSERIEALRAADPGNTLPIPVDLVTASGSGLDPHISPAAARYQVSRVARARGLDSAAVGGLVDRYTEGRQLGILGEPRVNVLLLNLGLDSVAPLPGPPDR